MLNKLKSASSSVIGASHEDDLLPLQDYSLSYKFDNGLMLVAIADGAGSCKHSDIGAKNIVNFICGEMHLFFDEYYETDDAVEKLTHRIEVALDVVGDMYDVDVEDLSSTLLFVAVKDDKFISGHIGDGAIICIDCNDELKIFSKPENDEDYDHLTWFTTSNYRKDRLRVKSGNMDEYNGFFLASDGVSDSIYNPKSDKLMPVVAKFIKILDHVSEDEAKVKIEEQLKGVFKQNSDDDLSIAVLKKIQVDSNEQQLNNINEEINDETNRILEKRTLYSCKPIGRSLCRLKALWDSRLGIR